MTAQPLKGNLSEEFPLEGFTIGITASRRRDELRKAFEKRGAKVVIGSSIEIVPLERDDELRAVSERCILLKPDFVVATTGIGFRGWMDAADGWGMGEELRNSIANAVLLARGPKARGSIRASGLTELWTPSSESMNEVIDYLFEYGVKGKTVVIQQHGEPQSDVTSLLSSAGATVVNVQVYRWVLPQDLSEVKRLVAMTISGQIDCITFTSAPAVFGLLEVANQMGMKDKLLSSMQSGCLPACVGPVCSSPLERRGVVALTPDRARLGAMIHVVADELPRRHRTVFKVAGHDLQIRGSAVDLDGTIIYIPPAPMQVLKALAADPGKVLSRAELIEALPSEDPNPHALEMSVARLRSMLGDAKIIQTVVKRGYRLACS